MVTSRFAVRWRLSVLSVLAAITFSTERESFAATDPPARPTILLDGQWSFTADPENVGEKQQWFSDTAAYSREILVPGSWEAQGVGKEGVVQFIRHVYMGKAWYRRQVDVPEAWSGKRIWLKIGGSHRFADVWFNGTHVGSHDGFVSAYKFEVTKLVRLGAANTIAIRVDNAGRSKDDYGAGDMRGCFNYYHPWGGIYRSVSLEATSSTYVDDVFVRPDIDSQRAVFEVTVAGPPEERKDLSLQVEGTGVGFEQRFEATSAVASDSAGKVPRITAAISNPRLWSPARPDLYAATIRLFRGGIPVDEVAVRFGMRKIEAKEHQILLNGKPIYLRGFGDDAIEPLTGFPPASKEVYRQRFETAKKYGFFFVRYHSWCPPPECFEAADEVGFLLQPELQVAYDGYREQNRAALLAEWPRLILQNRNHPSFMCLAMGNEQMDTPELASFAAEAIRISRELAPGLLIQDSDGVLTKTKNHDIVSGAWEPAEWPAIFHELGNFNSLEDFSEIPKYRGPYLPASIRKVKSQLEAAGLMKYYDRWLHNSRELQRFCRKRCIEDLRCLSWPAGFQYWMITNYDDMPGAPAGAGLGPYESGANIGIFNSFWEPKSNADPDEYRKFNSDTVVLARLPSGYYLTGGAAVHIPVLVSHFGGQSIRDEVLAWRFVLDERVAAEGEMKVSAAQGAVTEACRIELTPPAVAKPAKARLCVRLALPDGSAENDWPVMVFPSATQIPASASVRVIGGALHRLKSIFPHVQAGHDLRGAVCVSQGFPAGGVDYLNSGGRLLCFGRFGNITAEKTGGFNSSWWADRSNLGTMIASHPVFANYPHDGYCGPEFLQIMQLSDSKLDLSALAPDIEPIIWSIPQRKGFLFEMSVGKGRLMVSSLDLPKGIAGGEVLSQNLFVRIIEYLSQPELPDAYQLAPQKLAEALGSDKTQVPEGPYLAGFQRVTCPGEATKWTTYRDEQAPVYVCRQTNPANVVSWESEAVPQKIERDTVTLVFAGVLGYVSQPQKEGFVLRLNNQELLAFDIAQQSRDWTSTDGKAKLVFSAVHDTGPTGDAFGLFYLTLDKSLLEPGHPCQLSVQSKSADSNRWFGLNAYTDLLE